MINCNFVYSKELLEQIARNSTRKVNRILEICLVLMLISIVVIFCAGEVTMGVIFSVMFVAFVISLIVTNISIRKSSNLLLNQRVELQFDKDFMYMKTYIGEDMLSNSKIDYSVIKKIKNIEGLMYLYISNNSAVIIPVTAFETQEQCKKAMDFAGNNYTM